MIHAANCSQQAQSSDGLEVKVHWSCGLAMISASRLARLVERIADLQPRLAEANQSLVEAKWAHGLGDSTNLSAAKQSVAYASSLADDLGRLGQVISYEQDTVERAVASYVRGEVPHLECGSIQLCLADDGRLHIYFNLDSQPAGRIHHDGHLVVGPDGYMEKMSTC